ncbi:MAG: hypothetical protein ACLQIB_30670 [Isosphaeraceae bacterium]
MVRPFEPPPVLMAFLVVFSLLGMQGCGDADKPRGLTKQAVAISNVPEVLRKAAQKAVPGVELNEAWKNLDGTGKLHSYEIRGRSASNGKIREVRVSIDGQILETE